MVELSPLSRRILRELCMDSRVTITELSNKFNISRPIIAKRIEAMEKELGLYYTIEPDYKALGLGAMTAIYLKFRKKPPEELLSRWLTRSKMVQLSLKTEGDFDMLLFSLAENDEEFAKWSLNIGVNFSDYGASTSKSDMDILHHGIVPLNNETLSSAKIDDVYKRLLLELNLNSRISIIDLSKKVKMHEEMTRYYLRKLMSMNIIKRFTAVITRPPQCSNAFMFMKYTYGPGSIGRIIEKRKVYFAKEEIPFVFNDWQMVATTSGGSDELVWGTAGTDKDVIEDRIRLHERMFKKDFPIVNYGLVRKVMKGTLGIRSVDVKSVYIQTVWEQPLTT